MCWHRSWADCWCLPRFDSLSPGGIWQFSETRKRWTIWQTKTHRIHGAGIYANIGGILMVNVTIYSSTMDPMGNGWPRVSGSTLVLRFSKWMLEFILFLGEGMADVCAAEREGPRRKKHPKARGISHVSSSFPLQHACHGATALSQDYRCIDQSICRLAVEGLLTEDGPWWASTSLVFIIFVSQKQPQNIIAILGSCAPDKNINCPRESLPWDLMWKFCWSKLIQIMPDIFF